MPHTIIYNPEKQVIELKVQGDLTLDYFKEILKENVLAIKEKGGTCVLHDYREANFKLSTSEIYQMPGIVIDTFASFGLNARVIKRLAVVAKDYKDARFLETVFVNNALDLKISRDVNEAKQWVCGK
ncbi:MAG: hypothetical protein ABSG90_01945 [Dehalococcoidia bacterium]